MASVMDEFGINENQLATLLSLLLSSEQRLHECRIPVFDSAIIRSNAWSDLIMRLIVNLPYKSKYWQGTKFGELTNYHVITKFKSR